MKYATLGPIAVHYPSRIETNQDLYDEDSDYWHLIFDLEKKIGIKQRYIAEPDELSSDLAVKAAEKLFAENDIDPQSIDFLLFCTQSPDYPLPTTACLIQDRLGLPTSIGAIDFNLGCSGYVYGVSLADGLIQSGAAKRILFITAETYSKFISPKDKNLRPIFGDAAAATLIEAGDTPSLSHIRFGTDGDGANTLLATDKGFRSREKAIQPSRRKKCKDSDLFMDGAALMNFTVGAIPQLIDELLQSASLSKTDIEYYLMHQATLRMLELLRESCKVDDHKIPIRMEHIGNTVSCTLPILIDEMRRDGSLRPEHKNLLVGFGVGWSWAACVWQDHWNQNRD